MIAILKTMASITIRNLEDTLKARLRVRAATHGRSMEEEARDILCAALARMPSTPSDLAEAIQRRFSKFGGVELQLQPRESIRQPPGLDE